MKKLFFLSTTLILVAFLSCTKEKPAGGSSSINGFFTQNGAPVQTFNIDATNFQTINGSGGTVLYINPNSFVTQSNQPVTGIVTIELREIFTKKDMILSNAPTTSGGKLLVSGGEFYLSAKQNNQKLKLATNAGVYAAVPAGANPSYQMQEFYASSLDANNDWRSLDSAGAIPVFKDSMNPQSYYYFQLDSMNWVNTDYFYTSTGPTTTIAANAGAGFDSSNCFAFFTVKGRISAASFYYHNGSLFSAGPYCVLPIGLNGTFVAIAERNGQYYSAFSPSVLVSNHVEMLSLTPTTLAQIKQDLANLP